MNPIAFDHVWKRYQLGSKHDSLRDAIPALLKRWTSRNGHELKDGEFWALRDVSFSVTPKETVGIIGPNGAGKSTILKLLSRISKQTIGDVRVKGRLAALIEIGAGFHPDLTGRENVYLNGTIMGLRHQQINRLFEAIVEFSELGKFLDMPVKRYSSGMVVRLGFAIAAHVNPEVLLVDEVLAVGDLSFQQKCYQRILDLKARGTTIVFISHNLEAIHRLCDRVILLCAGQVHREGPPDEVILTYRQQVLRDHILPTAKRGNTSHTAGDLRIVRAECLNCEGQAQETFETGEALRLQMGYVAARPIRHPSVTVTLERLDGLICHEASTQASGLSWVSWEGGGSLTLEYPMLNLLPNTYQAVVRVYEGRSPVPLAQVRNALHFHVVSDRHIGGTVHLDHAWLSDTLAGGSSTDHE